MMKDWMTEAAKEIDRHTGGYMSSVDADDIRAIIAKRCPFESGVAYMPVPRCETCAHWRNDPHAVSDSDSYNIGDCCATDSPEFDRLRAKGIKILFHQRPLGFGCVQWEAKK